MAHILTCEQCSKPFESKIPFAKTCSSSCRTERKTKRYWEYNTRYNIPTGSVGAMNELRVSVDLLGRGLHVFRALSPACPTDLAVLKDGKLYRVEVTTGSYSRGGSVSIPGKDYSKFDVLAVALHDRIEYRPSLEEVGLA